MCKKQTSVSHSSTESEIISLDTGLRLDGLPALELWDLIVSVFGNISHVSDRAGQPVNGKNKSHDKIDVVHDIDLVPSNVQSASREALLYVFCRRIISYTSYSRTNDCIYNGYVNNNFEHNTMINIDTVAHMNMHYTQY